MKKFVKGFIIALAALSLSAIAVTGAGCSKNSGMSSWEIVEKQAGDVSLQQYAVLKLTMPSHTHQTGHSHSVKSIWVNVSGNTNCTLNFAFSYSSAITSSKQATYQVTPAPKNKSTWIKLTETENNDLEYTYVELCVMQSININEIVFLTVDGDKFTVELVKAGERAQRDSNSQNEWTAAELKQAVADGTKKNTALNLVDEQDKFPY